jgi:hypothetical protein
MPLKLNQWLAAKRAPKRPRLPLSPDHHWMGLALTKGGGNLRCASATGPRPGELEGSGVFPAYRFTALSTRARALRLGCATL